MGLYLVKMVSKFHGGEITVESTEGGGSKFSIWLPVKGPLKAATSSPSVLPSLLEASSDPVADEIKPQ